MGRFGVLLAGNRVLRQSVALVALALAVSLLGAASAAAQSPRVLVFHGPSDAVNDAGVAALEAIGAANGFEVDPTTDAATFTGHAWEIRVSYRRLTLSRALTGEGEKGRPVAAFLW